MSDLCPFPIMLYELVSQCGSLKSSSGVPILTTAFGRHGGPWHLLVQVFREGLLRLNGPEFHPEKSSKNHTVPFSRFAALHDLLSGENRDGRNQP